MGDAKSIDPAAREMLATPRSAGSDRLLARRRDEALPDRRDGRLLQDLHMGPCRFIGKDAERDRRLRRHLPTIAARNFARQVAAGVGRPLRPRPRPRLHAARGRPRRGRRLHDQGRAEAHGGRRLPGHRDRRPRRSTRSPSTSPTRPWRSSASRRARSSTRGARPEAPGALAQARHRRRAASTARSSRRCTARTIGVDQDAENILEHALRTLARRRLGRLDARHRHHRHPLRHAHAGAVRGQPRRPQGRQGQHRRPRPRAAALGDDRRRVARARDDRRTRSRRAPRASTSPASAAPPTRS